MNYKKGLLVFCLTLCILFSITSVVASDVNDTAIASEDMDDITTDKEVISSLDDANEINSKFYDDILTIEEDSENTLNIDENNLNEIVSKEVADDEPVLESTDKEVLSETIHIKITFYKQTGKTMKDKKVYFKVTNSQTGTGESFTNVQYEILKNGKSLTWGIEKTNINGKGVIDFSKIKENIGTGTFVVKGLLYDDLSIYYDELVESNFPSTKVKISGKQQVTIKPKKLSTTYKSGRYFKAKVIDSKTKKPVKGVKVILKVFTGKNAKTTTTTSNSKGYIKYSSSKLNIGKHKVVLKVKKSQYFKGKTKKSMIKISKARLKLSAPTVTAQYKKSTLFKVTVKNKKSDKPVKGIKVIMKVYTGKKYKIYKAKTNKKGKTGFNTKSLSSGKHKVVVIAKANSKYKKATSKSSVIIKKPKYKSKTSKGKTTPKGEKVFTILSLKSASKTNGDPTYYIKLLLKDSSGHPLANKEIQIKTIIQPMGASKTNRGVTDSDGILEGYINTGFGGDTTFEITATFAGDSSYYSSIVHAKL